MVLCKIINPSVTTIVPEYKTHGSAGFDFHLPGGPDKPYFVSPGVTKMGLNLAFKIPIGFEMQIRPRSSTTLSGLVVPTGTIDSDYTGEVSLIVINPSNMVFTFHGGDRLCQGVISPVVKSEFRLVYELPQTQRGAGGFGSTGS